LTICLADAKNATPPTYRGIVVECKGCGIYRVTESALAALRLLKIEHRFAVLRMAKTLVPSRVAPTITSGCLKP
jgi:hypothetical protein